MNSVETKEVACLFSEIGRTETQLSVLKEQLDAIQTSLNMIQALAEQMFPEAYAAYQKAGEKHES